MTDLWPTVPRVLAANNYMVLATADTDGVPWAAPVYFAPRDERRLYWVSSPDTRHSRNIATRPAVAITIFDSSAPIGAGEAVYADASAEPARDVELEALITVLNSRLPPDKALSLEDVEGDGPLVVYCATVSRHYVLVRGGDARFHNEFDTRVEVAPPA
jgi:uncharacterized protein YhbP (UPF0306 family)